MYFPETPWWEWVFIILVFSFGGWAFWQGVFWFFGHVHLGWV